MSEGIKNSAIIMLIVLKLLNFLNFYLYADAGKETTSTLHPKRDVVNKRYQLKAKT